MQYVGSRYVPKFMGAYDDTQDYEVLCVVDNGMGTSYISKIPVPAGTLLTDTEYWAVYGASSGAIIDLQNRVTSIESLTGSLLINPDTYTGTDIQKLQAAYDDAVDYCDTNNASAVILIDRKYDITGDCIFLHFPNSARNGHIKFIGTNHGEIYRGGDDDGYMFAELPSHVGGCKWHDFYNLRFRGDAMSLDARGIIDNSVSSNYTKSRVFNMTHLNNMRVSQCDFSNLSLIYDYSNSISSATGGYTIHADHNSYYWCTTIITLGYAQNAIYFNCEYIALGVRVLNNTANLHSFVGIHFIDCVIEYLNGYAFNISNTGAALYEFEIKGCYIEGILNAIALLLNPIFTVDISNNLLTVDGNIGTLTEGVSLYLGDDTNISFRNNSIIRNTAVIGYGFSINHSPSNGKKIYAEGLIMTDQNNNLVDCMQSSAATYAYIGEHVAYSNSGTHTYTTANTEETLDTTTITEGGIYKVHYEVLGNTGGVSAAIRVNGTGVSSKASYFMATVASVASADYVGYIPSGATLALTGKVENVTGSARDYSITVTRL